MCLQIISIYWIILQFFILSLKFSFKCITYPYRKIISLFIKLFKILLHKLLSLSLIPHFLSNLSHISQHQNPSHPKGFLNPTSNQCFANALLQCLYNLPPFQNLVLQAPSQNKILHYLSLLFHAMKSSSSRDKEIHKHKENLFNALVQYSPEVL